MSAMDSFARLSSREKLLISVLGALVVGGIILILQLWIGAGVDDLSDQIDTHREDLASIYSDAGEFLEKRAETEEMRAMAAANEDLNLKLKVNELAKRIHFTARNRRGEIEGEKKLADALQFDQTQETYLSKKKKKRKAKKGKKDSDDGYWRRDQPITLSENVPFEQIYELCEKLEDSDDLLYVTEIEMSRDFSDGRIARKNASLTVSTFYYKGSE